MMPDFILSPLVWTLLLALLLGAFWRRMSRWLALALLAVELLLVVAMTPLGANRLVHMVESRVPATAACHMPSPGVIVLLSGGVDRPARAIDDYPALTRASLERLFAAVALWHAHPDDMLAISGGSPVGSVPESKVLASLAHRMGVSVDKLRVETHSRTTWENASNLAREQPPLPRRIWLVSSALHLPRAMQAFQAFGFEPCAWSSGSAYMPFSASVGYFMPQTSSLAKADRAIHELMGGWAYAWRARHLQEARPEAPPR
jgi:uncharacterized SAM-binding protein YcdF (DUF218 family)